VAFQTPAFLGAGLLRPFVRDQKQDFANASGVDLVRACVGQILGTRASDDSGEHQGELEWRPDFGSKLYLLQHRKGPLLSELARFYVVEALSRWEPRVTNIRAAAAFDRLERSLTVDLVYDIIAANVPGNNVLFSDVEQSVSIAVAA
jgi:phage baseplate assembly protein W